MGTVLRVAALCLLSTAIVLLLQRYLPDYAFAAAVAAGVGIGLLLLQQVSQSVAYLMTLLQRGNLTTTFSVLLKAVGMAYVTEFCADTCRDFGQSALAAKVELCGKVAILLCGLPLLERLLETALGFADS